MCDKPLYIVMVGKKQIIAKPSFDEAGDELEANGYKMAESTSGGRLNYLEVPHENVTSKVAKMHRKCLD